MARIEICQANNLLCQRKRAVLFLWNSTLFLCYYVMPPNASGDWHLSGNMLFLAVSICYHNIGFLRLFDLPLNFRFATFFRKKVAQKTAR